jgi:hypothetical protein
MPEPLFSQEERVSTTQLPAELRDEKDPAKVAAYYQRREAQLREEMRRSTQGTPPPPNTRVTMEQNTDEPPVAASFSVEEAQSARATLIATARQTARQNKPYWDRLSDEIERLMKTQPPENQVNSGIWETAYNTLLGMNMDRLLKEDKDRADAATRAATERSSVPPDQTSAPAPLPVEVTAKVLPGLHLSEAQYREAQDRISKGSWPLTAENIGGARKMVGG